MTLFDQDGPDRSAHLARMQQADRLSSHYTPP
jgi:hypothetical protein